MATISAATVDAPGGPPLVVPAAAAAVFTVASVALGAAAPRPGASAAVVTAYLQTHSVQTVAGALVVFAVSLPLAIFAAAAYQRLRRLGVDAPGAVMALAGGILSATSIAFSGLAAWAAAENADPAQPGIGKALTDLAFAAGGPGFAVPFALLIAGIAVPGLVARLLPRPLAWAGIAVAAIGMASTLTIASPALDPLLPITRFAGLAWIVAAAILLPTTARGRVA